MTRSNSLALIFVLEAMFLIISIEARHSITFPQKLSNTGMIIDICNDAPYNFDHCLSVLLQSNPSADIWGLVVFFVDDMEEKAKDALAKINALQRARSGYNAALDSCRKNYNTILVADIPKAREALKKRDTKISEGPLNDAFNKVQKCETDFPRQLTPQNNLMRDDVGDTIYMFKLTHGHA
ncbi:hypothetical protein TanjilG_04510 [Lupinus angustifolius]|uniref:Pectinesterase inhibitor domain-containing protein n=1 Tax=Lupinus angustifolius TaxID=3871 RepID=A0A4P1RR30_LUPAN|nr:hypothetical protein TanjilG_04510 [Lupinus angustifolius]